MNATCVDMILYVYVHSESRSVASVQCPNFFSSLYFSALTHVIISLTLRDPGFAGRAHGLEFQTKSTSQYIFDSRQLSTRSLVLIRFINNTPELRYTVLLSFECMRLFRLFLLFMFTIAVPPILVAQPGKDGL